jgi:hypothetical protein
MLRAQQARFEEKFGRPPGPDDPLFFDPDADHPQFLSLPEIEQATVGLLESAGSHPAWISAHQRTGGLLPRPDGGFAAERDRLDWQQAIDRYRRAHPGADPVDHATETAKLRNVLVAITVGTAAEHPEYGSAMARRLDRPATPEGRAGSAAEPLDGSDEDDLDVQILGSYLTTCADELVAEIRSDEGLQAAPRSTTTPATPSTAEPANRWPASCWSSPPPASGRVEPALMAIAATHSGPRCRPRYPRGGRCPTPGRTLIGAAGCAGRGAASPPIEAHPRRETGPRT